MVNQYSRIGLMYDNGTHGDEIESDTIFTMEFVANKSTETNLYFSVTAAYQKERNRYVSQIVNVKFVNIISEQEQRDAANIINKITENYQNYLASHNIIDARQMAFEDALREPSISDVEQCGNDLCIIYENKIRGVIKSSL